MFLFVATSDLRFSQLCQLTMDDIDEDKQMIVPHKDSKTKQTWVTFYNDEAAEAFEAFKPERKDGDERVFQTTKQPLNRKFRHVSEDTGVKITVQKLRRWFATEMSRCGVDAKYIDAFCGRTPSSVLERHEGVIEDFPHSTPIAQYRPTLYQTASSYIEYLSVTT